MPKQKYRIFTVARKKHLLHAGVFFLVICAIWALSFIFVGGNAAPSGSGGFEPGEEVAVQEKLPFSAPDEYPVMIMFDNHPDALAHQVGLSAAAVVYEMLSEGGATRFAGVYAGAPLLQEKIGPVRSARPYIVDTAAGWSAFFWHAGGSPEALELIPKTDVVDLNEISGLGIRYFWRDTSIPRPHNLFTSGDLVALGIDDFGLADALPEEKLAWNWSNDPVWPETAEPASSVYIDFSKGVLFDASYEYNADTETYLRFMGGAAHNDAATGEQLAPANIIIQRVPREGYYPSGQGRISLDMIGEGDMLLFQGGYVIEGIWRKETRDSQTQWLSLDGEPL
ncbi:MAG: DUF3048 domain-containing protein, partial [bacterium]|nr:DUF3048 domain-containing protein [bacterium]